MEVGGVAVAGDIDIVPADLVRLAVEGLSDVTKELRREVLSGLRIATAVMIHTWSTAWSAEVQRHIRREGLTKEHEGLLALGGAQGRLGHTRSVVGDGAH